MFGGVGESYVESRAQTKQIFGELEIINFNTFFGLISICSWGSSVLSTNYILYDKWFLTCYMFC